MARAALIACLAVAWLPDAASAAEDGVARVVIAVASNTGDADDVVLRWAESDARRFVAMITRLGRTAPENTFVVLGEGGRALDRALDRAAQRVEALRRTATAVELIAYVAAHADNDALHLAGDRFPMRTFYDRIEAINAHTRIGFVDTCYAGSVWRGAGEPGRRVQHRQTVDGTVFIASAADNEVAHESGSLGASYFAHHLLTAMQGAADADGNGAVSMREAYRYTYAKTLELSFARTENIQRPQFRRNVAGEGEVVLTWPSTSETRLVVPDTVVGSLLVVDDRTHAVVLQVEHEPGAGEHRYAIRPGRYRVLLRRDGALRAGEVVIAPKQDFVLLDLPVAHVSPDTLTARGRYFDPNPLEWALLAEMPWRWLDRGDTHTGHLGLALGLEAHWRQRAALRAHVRYTGSLGPLGQGLGVLHHAAVDLIAAYAYENADFSLRLGAVGSVGVGVQASDSTTVSVLAEAGGTVVLGWSLGPQWSLEASARGGSAWFREGASTRMVPSVQAALGVRFGL